MDRFTKAISDALDADNWFAALSLSLMLPDICGALETPSAGNGERYKRWFTQWIQPTYTISVAGSPHTFLTAADCWQLRCSYLHAGNGEIKTKATLDSFHFIQPPGNGNVVHRNQSGGVLQLQIDVFCRDFIDAVMRWDHSTRTDQNIQDRKKLLLGMHTTAPAIHYPHVPRQS